LTGTLNHSKSVALSSPLTFAALQPPVQISEKAGSISLIQKVARNESIKETTFAVPHLSDRSAFAKQSLPPKD
jgi:hypothetical protein